MRTVRELDVPGEELLSEENSVIKPWPSPSSKKVRINEVPEHLDEQAQVLDVAVAATAVLRMPVFFMRIVFLWPEGLNAVARVIAKSFYPLLILLNLELILGGLSFIFLDEHDNFVPPLTTFGDVTACAVCVAKLVCLHNGGPQLVEMRRQLQYGFHALESMVEGEAAAANAKCVSRCRKISIRFASFYLLLGLSASAMVVLNGLDDAEHRRLATNFPKPLLRNSLTYWPLYGGALCATIAFLFYSVGYDTLFLSLCLHLSCKCDILMVMLRRAGEHNTRTVLPLPQQGGRRRYPFEYWKDDGTDFEATADGGSSEEVDDHLRTCVVYHHKIIKLRDETEHIFASVSLFQMAYILLALGIPGLRLMHEKTVSFADATFLVFYAAWNFSQLLFYCWFADILAESSHEVSVAAYAAMRIPQLKKPLNDGVLERGDAGDSGDRVVNLGKSGGTTLQLITLRAQRPLHLTAGRFANLTLVLYLEIMRRSQSIYSYLIRLR